MWIWEQPNWPEWEYDIRAMASQLDEVARAIGRLQVVPGRCIAA